MPSRKSDSSETKTESRRSSLRRLSSIASLHTLNPFTRRRSNNGVTSSEESTPQSSTSNTSLSSTVANAPHKYKDFSSSQIFIEHDNIKAVPPPPPLPQQQWPSKRSSYICLPDDPIGGMPRSRTFSNLPLPTRAAKTTNPLIQSKSHARLPSSLLSESRLPSPPASTRKQSISRLTAVQNLPTRNKLISSDTEPLLHATYHEGVGLQRSTAFKENISLSPVKPLSSLDLRDDADLDASKTVFPAHASPQSHLSSRHVQGLGSLPSAHSSSTLSLSKYEQLPNKAYKRLSLKYDSSPAYRSSRDRAPTPGKPVQRWNSQPILSNKTHHVSPHGQIKQSRLMSAKQAPTPPPKTPLGSLVLEQPKSRRDSHEPGHVHKVSEKTPIARLQSAKPRCRAQTLEPTIASIHRAEPLAYWTGRFSSLNDRYRNQDLLASLQLGPEAAAPVCSIDYKSKSETDKLSTPAANSARMRRAVEYLYYQCANEEARESFLKWQKQLAVALNLPELARPIGSSANGGRSCALEMSLKETGDTTSSPGDGPSSSGRKMKFVDRLLGRRQKSMVASGA